jgi:hypothetical protein
MNVDEQGRLPPQSPMTSSIRSFATTNANPYPGRTHSAMSTYSTTGKRAGTAAHEFVRRHEVPATLHGGHRFKGAYKGAPIADDGDFDFVSRFDGEDPDASFEGLDNVRGELLEVSLGPADIISLL